MANLGLGYSVFFSVFSRSLLGDAIVWSAQERIHHGSDEGKEERRRSSEVHFYRETVQGPRGDFSRAGFADVAETEREMMTWPVVVGGCMMNR